jgi:tetratricopeptide (TPR) repeat protein
VSQSPLGEEPEPGSTYIDAFRELAQRIRKGASFSGRERNCAFLNLGGESFADASAALGLDLEQDSRGIALCDWDHDGDIDLWMTNRTAPRLQFMRNESAAAGKNSVSFLLVGDLPSGCPLDAAGARLVLSAGGTDRVQTVHLGDGFLSQSSRWLHFGLGGLDKIDRVVVHWPAGGAEAFEGAEVGGRYVLKQLTGKATAEQRKGSKVVKLNELELPEPTGNTRIWLSEPADLPADLALPNFPEGPALLNLWASWCAPCLAELKAFGAVDGLPVVPINTENLEGNEGISAKKAKSILKSAGIDQAGGFANRKLIEALDKIITDRIYRHRNIPLPASFLLDKDRRVRVIYKGKVDVATVAADLKKLSEANVNPKDAAVPFPGRWSDGIFKKHPVAVARAYREGGYDEDARDYLQRSLEKISGEDAGGKLRLADVHMRLGNIDRDAGKYESAINHYRQAIAGNPQLMPARIFLTLSLAEAGRSEEALQMVANLKEVSAGNPNFLNLEADVHRALGNEAQAAAGYRSVLAINHRYIPAIEALASILATSADAGIRDGVEAVKMAEHLGGAPGARVNPRFLLTIADAYAEAGDFDRALQEAENALKYLLLYGDDQKINRLQKRTIQFKEKKPYRRGQE